MRCSWGLQDNTDLEVDNMDLEVVCGPRGGASKNAVSMLNKNGTKMIGTGAASRARYREQTENRASERCSVTTGSASNAAS